MNLINRLQSVASNPSMVAAYRRWLVARLATGKPPRTMLPGGATIGGWLSFSEYWSFRDIVPNAERLFVQHCLNAKPRGGIAVDIGANVGVFTCLIASLGPHMVHAFEPIPETFCRLKDNVKSNGLLDRCRLNCLAAGRANDLVTFHIQEDSPATNHLAMPGDRPTGNATSTQVVAAIDLDGYCRSQGIDFIDFLKIDVEGMEPYVLQGAKELLRSRKIAAILIEICPVNLHSVSLTPEDLFKEFEAAGYSPFALNDDGTPGDKLTLLEIEAMKLANIILLPA